MALYLKYRPQNFADVVGQDHIVTTLEQAVSHKCISHAYLLCGTRGTGKTSVARILAKTILMTDLKDEAIREQMIKGIEEGSFVDLVEIDAASNRRIDDIRELIEKINFSPAVSRAKVYIIDEVHMLTKEAFNALLKTLEEPPEYAYFILATTELHKVPDTIQSRCQRFLFKRVRDDDIIRRLQYIVDQEHIKVDRDALRAIARHALGSFRDGISLLDQLRSLDKISLADVTDRLGRTSLNFIEEIVDALGKKDLQGISAVLRQVEESNVPVDLIASDLLSIIRTQMHEAIDKKESPAPFVHMTNELLTTIRNIRISPLPALVLEAALYSLCMETTQTDVKIMAPVRINMPKIEPSAEVTQQVKAVAQALTKEEPAPTKGALIEVDELTVQTVLRHWNHILQTVNPPSVRMSLKNASVAQADEAGLRLTFPSGFHKDRVAETKASRAIEDILFSIYKRPIKIVCELEKDTRATEMGPSTDLAEAAAEVFSNM